MKKTISIIVLLSIVFAFSACSISPAPTQTPVPTPTPVPPPTDEEIKAALDESAAYIKEAHDLCVSTANVLLDHWTAKYTIVFQPFFLKEDYEECVEMRNGRFPDDYDRDLDKVWSDRDKIDSLLSSAMEIMRTIKTNENTENYYQAVKEYYKNIDVFHVFISTWPEGYSELTYSSTLADYKSDCQSAYAELEFYK